MSKKKKLAFKRNVTKLNYWKDWSLYNKKDNQEFLRIPIASEKEIEAGISKLLNEIRVYKRLTLIHEY